ncbi:hypothetical protein [Soonwooa purpurea]
MDKVLNYLTDHPLSTGYAFASPLMIPNEYHSVFAQLILTLGTQIVLFVVEKLNKTRVKEKLSEKEKDKENGVQK